MSSDSPWDSSSGDGPQAGIFADVGDLVIVAVSVVVVLGGVAAFLVWGVPSLVGGTGDATSEGIGGGNSTDSRTEPTADTPTGGDGSGSTPTATSEESKGERPPGAPETEANASGGGWHDLRLTGESGRMEPYAITVTGELRRSGPPDPNDDGDVIGANGTRVTGEVGGGTDTYEFTGSVTRVRTGENVTVYVDGRPIAESRDVS